ncbi:hypothetical protein AOLI_G00258590 [Acnodon oligacanthus]
MYSLTLFPHTSLPPTPLQFTLLLVWSATSTSQILMSSCIRAGGLCHGGRTAAATGLRLQVDGGLGLRLSLEKSAAVASRLDLGQGPSPTCPPNIMSQTITLSGNLTPLSGSALTATDGGFGLVGCGEWLTRLISKVKELQEEKVTLEARLTQLCGGIHATTVDNGSVMSVMEQEDKLVKSRRVMKCLVLDTFRLQRVLDNIRTSALQLKVRALFMPVAVQSSSIYQQHMTSHNGHPYTKSADITNIDMIRYLTGEILYDIVGVIRFQLEADIAAMKKDIAMTSRVQVKLEAKRARLWKDLYFITKVLQEGLLL